ncbi:Putative LOC100203204 [Caligus rogercresseyi]|uniref:LOC100203204 n=1 Tax=Caligus rogercresseyi TaxID=217165 RepID=A0A7T8K7H5_CALRO|nr:Putative LOC100203204 [Caligus rogercresseyi]
MEPSASPRHLVQVHVRQDGSEEPLSEGRIPVKDLNKWVKAKEEEAIRSLKKSPSAVHVHRKRINGSTITCLSSNCVGIWT